MACSCPRGDELVVRAESAEDAARLMNDFGFAAASPDAMSIGAKSCNTNAWDPNGQTRGTARDLGTWAEGKGAHVSYAGFVSPTEPLLTCQACGCPRGDEGVVFVDDDASKDKLAAEGFTPLQ